MANSIIAVIPAHLASVRFLRKVLFPLHGLPMIEHVRRRALLATGISEVVVATCDQEIADVVRGYGGRVVMTSNGHANGTSRVGEAVQTMDCSHVMLLQGDEPLLLPRHLDAFARAITGNPVREAWNATGPIDAPEELDRHSFVKCAVTSSDRILYCFRRNPSHGPFDSQQAYIRKILGMIAFRKSFLLDLTRLSPSPIEQRELIEQMRIIENGHSLWSVPVSPSLPSVNEPGEADIVLEHIRRDAEQADLVRWVLKQ